MSPFVRPRFVPLLVAVCASLLTLALVPDAYA